MRLTDGVSNVKLLPVMKKIVFFLTVVLLLTVSFPIFAQPNWSEEKKKVVLEVGEVIDHDYFAVGESVTISGIVNGDVFAGAGSIFIDGQINGDLIAGAGTITLVGEVSQDVRVGGGTISIQGIVGQNVTVAGGNISITKDAFIGGSVLVMGGNVETLGMIGKDFQAYSGKVLLGGNIGRDVRGEMGELAIVPKTTIAGDLTYTSPNEADLQKESTVAGEIAYTKSEKKVSPQAGWQPNIKSVVSITQNKDFSRIKTGFKFFGFMIAFILGFILMKVFPKGTMKVVQVLEDKPWPSLGVGILTPTLFLMGMILLTITIVGIPLGLLLMPVFGFIVYFSKIFTALFVGRKVLLALNMNERRGWALFAGLLVYYLFKLVPLVGFFSGLAFTLFGLGAFILYQKSVYCSAKAQQKKTLKIS